LSSWPRAVGRTHRVAREAFFQQVAAAVDAAPQR
jgi:hypothetical protein